MSSTPKLPVRWRLWMTMMALGVFLSVFWAHGWMVRSFGSDLPYWDQWDAEGATLLLPWKNGSLSWHHFYQPQNEHRVVLTKLMVLALAALGGAVGRARATRL